MARLSKKEADALVKKLDAKGREIQRMLKELGLEGITGDELVHRHR